MPYKKPSIIFALLSLLTSMHLYAGQSSMEVVPDFYNTPGISATRDYVNQNTSEYIDPFTGALKQVYTDIYLPGNGGFDLSIVRAYNSSSVHSRESYSPLGLGWTLHMGRIIRSRNRDMCSNILDLSVLDNPILELPDGSRQLLAFTGGSHSTMLTTQLWKGECITSNYVSGLTVTSPEGIRYEMTQKVRISGGPYPVYGWYTTKIIDPNGNYATITYDADYSPEIRSISTNDGRRVDFSYYDSGESSRRIKSISAGSQTYNYDYSEVADMYYTYQLTRVRRPDGRSWNYQYNTQLNFPNAGGRMMRQVEWPEGGTIDYQYDYTRFDDNGNTPTIVKKTNSVNDTWRFAYYPGRKYGELDKTLVTTPEGEITYRHYGARTISSGSVWKVGLLASKTLGSEQTEYYEWTNLFISRENFLRPGKFSGRVDHDTYAPVLKKKTINRDGANYITEYANFDDYGNARTVTEQGNGGGNRTTQYTYNIDTDNWIVHQINSQKRPGLSLKRTFDRAGNMTSTNTNGITTQYRYDRQGNVSSMIDPRSLQYTYASYYRGRARSETQPENIHISRTISDQGNLLSETNGRGKTTRYRYNAINQLTDITPPTGNATHIDISYPRYSIYPYYDRGYDKITTRGNLVEKVHYGDLGRIESVTTAGIKTTYRTDGLGRITFKSYPGQTTGIKYIYDDLNRLTVIDYSNKQGHSHHSTPSLQKRFNYGSNAVQVQDENNHATTYYYRIYGDPSERYLTEIKPHLAPANLVIERNQSDLPVKITQNKQSRTFAYDSKNHLIAETHPESGTTTYVRDALGNITTKRVGSNPAIHYQYDGQNRLTRIDYPASEPDIRYSYSATGKLLNSSAGNIQRTYQYDNNDNLTHETLQVDGQTFAMGYHYNANDQLQSLNYPVSGEQIALNPDALGRPQQVGPWVTSVAYWPSGHIKQMRYGNRTDNLYTLNQRLWPIGINVKNAQNNTIVNRKYQYDNVGNLTQITDYAHNSLKRTLGYDSLNRLISAQGPWGEGFINYDGQGNILAKDTGNDTLQYHYSHNRLTSLSGTAAITFQYDNRGNTTSDGQHDYRYNAADNLICIDCTRTHPTHYQYDANNLRTLIKETDKTTYEIRNSAGQLLAEYQPAIKQLRSYFYLAQQRVAERTTSDGRTKEIVYFHNNPQGSPEVTTDTNGKQLWVESYLPYGHRYGHSSALNASTNHLWFTGKPQDSETGLVYMGARYYNPIAGRFLSIDPQSVTTDNIHGFNRYAYANNNPYRYVDPDGRMPLLALLAFPSAGAAMVQATVDAAVIVGSVYAMIHGNGGDDAGKGSSPANGSSQGDPNNGKGLNKALGAAGVAKGGEDLLKGTRYTNKVERQMKGKDLDHNFPSLIDKQANAAKIKKITGGDGIERTKMELPGSVNGKNGNYTWIIEPDKTVNHRQFERIRTK